MPVEVKCDYCGEEFQKKPGQVRENNFCSQECYHKWKQEDKKRNPNWNGGKVTKICEECGEEFKVWPSREERKFCSEECKNKAHSKFMEGRGRNRKTVECDWCGKEFEKIESHVREHNFCSRECQGKYYSENRGGEDYWGYKGKQVTKKCKMCGKEFTVPEAWIRKGRGRFCSRECYGKWYSENICGGNHPAWKGGYEPYYGPNWYKQRRKARERDNHTCQLCGAEKDGKEHDVHHIIPFREFGLENYKKANSLDNLITLCRSCHSQVENGGIELAQA